MFTQANVKLNFGASTALADSMEQGAFVDVFASADQTNMTRLQEKKLVHAPRTFAHNTLAIVVKPGNPKGIATLADLATAGTIALCAVDVPCGTYAAQSLTSAKVTIEESHITRSPNVAATLDQVAEGDAVAAIVYVTDAKSRADQVDTVTIPATQNVIGAYPIARVGPARKPAADRFIEFVLSVDGQRILKKYGFLP